LIHEAVPHRSSTCSLGRGEKVRGLAAGCDTADIDTPIEGTWTGERNSATLPSDAHALHFAVLPGRDAGEPSGTSPQVLATGQLGTDTLVLTDTQTGERATYRKR